MDTTTVQNDDAHSNSKNLDSRNWKTLSNDSGCDSPNRSVKSTEEDPIEAKNEDKTTQDETDFEDIFILRKDPKTNRSVINKRAYLRLHRATSPTGRSASVLKEKYEVNSDIETYLRSRNTDSSLGSYRNFDNSSRDSSLGSFQNSSDNSPDVNLRTKIPIPQPRSLVRSDNSSIRTRPHTDSTRSRFTFPFNGAFTRKDENSNDVLRKNSSSSGEFITIVTRSDSEGSIDKLQSELDLFTMDEKTKDKKRSNSFRRLFSGKIFSKEKKKKDELEPQNRVPCKENVVYSDNMKNESNAFNRHAPYRHTVGSGSNSQKDIKLYRNDSQRSMQKSNFPSNQVEQRYAQMHINEFNQIKRNFENTRPPRDQYVNMDKPLITNNPGPINYNKMGNLSRYIDSSSSVSTLESERDTMYQNEVISNAHKQYLHQQQQNMKQQQLGSLPNTNTIRSGEMNKEYNRDTPPRAQELRQDVRLVNPKALIPINSERPLPNPYHHSENISNVPTFRSNSHQSLRTINQLESKGPHFEETYSTVFDSVDHPQRKVNEGLQRTASLRNNMKPLEHQRPPRSPSLESTKLKLPANREIVPLSPRMKSPIPQDGVSTEKIIATELLKPRTPTPTRKPVAKPLSPSHQKLEIAIDYPDNVKEDRSDNNSVTSEAISEKPSLSGSAKSPENPLQIPGNTQRQLVSPASSAPEQYRSSPISHRSQSQSSVYRISAASPIPELQEQITTNAVVHVNSMNLRSPSQTNLNHLRSLSPSARSVTPVDLRTPTSNCSQSPQKDEIRRNVEAYYWKELKRLKEQENLDMYYYQMQMMRTPNGYAEDPITTRRARSMSPTSQRNGRRSLSLPRDPKPSNQPNQQRINQYGRPPPNVIPEDRIIPNQNHLFFDFNTQKFRRNAPERRTVDSVQRNFDNNSLYRPIFKRGSLTAPYKDLSDDGQNKRVSFSNSKIDVNNPQSWPTKNGYTQSPPQRRNTVQGDDDVFLPSGNNPQTSRLIIDGKEIYGYTNKPPNYAEHQQRQNMLAQQRGLYDSPPNSTYGSTKPPRESPYGPLVVANVRQQKTNNNQETPYGPLVVTNNRPPEQMKNQDDSLYGQPIDAVQRPPNNLTRHGSVQLSEPMYAQKPPLPRKMSYDASQGALMMRNDNHRGPRREIIMTDDIFGQFGGYLSQNGNMRYPHPQNVPQNVQRPNMMEQQYQQNVPQNVLRQNAVDPQYQQNGFRQVVDTPYGYTRAAPRQVSVRNKVCDIYGQIHDSESSRMAPAQQRSGVILGQLQNSNQGVRQQSYGQLPNENFTRNSRLTASANDMYRRYQNVDPRLRNDVYQNHQRQNAQDGPPNRPLPPVPTDKRLQQSNKSKTDNSSNDTQKVKKNKKRGFFGLTNDSTENKNNGKESSHNLSLDDLRRVVLLEELHLIRIQKEVINSKYSNYDGQGKKFSSSLDTKDLKNRSTVLQQTEDTKKLKMSDLKRLVLTEKLQLVRMQIQTELENVKQNKSIHFAENGIES